MGIDDIDKGYNGNVLPDQFKTYREKYEDKGKWWKETAAYYIKNRNVRNHDDIVLLKKAVEGEVDESHYKRVLDPIGLIDQNLTKAIKKLPINIRHYDILSEVVDRLLGERAGLPETVSVVIKGDKRDNQTQEEFTKIFKEGLEKTFINKLNDTGLDTGMESEEVSIPKKDEFFANSKEIRSMHGHDLLQYIYSENDIIDKRQEMWRDWVICDTVCSYKDARLNDIYYERVDPEEISVFGNSTFIEDADAVVRHMRLTIHQIIDRWRDELKELNTLEFDVYDYLQKYNDNFSSDSVRAMKTESDFDDNIAYADTTLEKRIDVYHTTFKTFVKIGILTYNGLFGNIQKMEVPEDYKLDKSMGDISIEYIWLNEIWEACKIGNDESKALYFNGKPLEVQRAEITNSSEVKHPYNGRIVRTRNQKIYSIISKGLNNQIIYNIVKYQFEKTLNKNKDKIVFIPQGAVPSKQGWNEFDLMLAADSVGFAMYDEGNAKTANAVGQMKAIDLSLNQYLKQLYEIIQEIKEDWFNSIGFNRQRRADVNSSDGKATTEYALSGSAIITKERFRLFDKFEEKDDQGLLDLSRFAYKDGLKADFITPDGYNKYLELDSSMHPHDEMGVFVRDRLAEKEKLNKLKEFAFSFAQNDKNPEMISEIIENDNFAKIKNIMRRFFDAQQEYEKSLEDNKLKSNEAINKEMIAMEDKKVDANIEIAQIRADATVEAALISADTKNNTNDENDNGIDDFIDRRRQAFEERKHKDTIKFKYDELASKEKIAKENQKKAQATKNK